MIGVVGTKLLFIGKGDSMVMYEKPKMELILLETEDIVTSSDPNELTNGGQLGGGDIYENDEGLYD